MRKHDLKEESARFATAAAGASSQAASGTTSGDSRAWLLEHRVTVPDRVTGFVERTALIRRCLPTQRRLTLLHAPGGFGKTVTLAECCRKLAGRGVAIAWLALDGEDEPSALETYLAHSLQRAGVDVLEPLRAGDERLHLPHDRLSLLLRAIESHDSPCVLVLDELERISNPESVKLLNLLVRSGAPKLHVAMACRELPMGLDITGPMFAGETLLVTSDDLRFSREEIARFFNRSLSQRELAAVVADSAGWPIALRMRRKSGVRAPSEADRVVRGVVANWMESRLWYDLTEDDQEFLFDVGLLEWIDPELLDEVLGGTDLMHRLQGLLGVAGLLEQVGVGARSAWRLHPLIREYCGERCRRRTPERYRAIHCRIAAALARRGGTVAAVRHAAEGEDVALVGRILTEAGGVRLWLREGSARLMAVDRHAGDELLQMFPRLLPMRAVGHALRGHLGEARRMLDTAAELAVCGSAPEPEVQGDLCMARGMVAQNACEAMDSARVQALAAEMEHVAGLPGVEPLVRGTAEYGLCVVHNLKAEFDAALLRSALGLNWIGVRSPYLTMAFDFQLGQIAMAQGRVQAAVDRYEVALQAAKRQFLQDPRLTLMGEVLVRELDLQRNRIGNKDKVSGTLLRDLWRGGAQFAIHAAASDLATDLVSRKRGPEAGLEIVQETGDNARRAQLPALVRYLDAVQVDMLVAADRIGEAERCWQACGLPASSAGCVDLAGQTWREMEALSCARLRLAIARREFAFGRRIAADLVRVAIERGLRRTWMRALVMAMVLEEAAGDRARALEHLEAFLALFVETDYARALTRESKSAAPLLKAFLDAEPEARLAGAAQAILRATRDAETSRLPELSEREADVLARLDTKSDQQIAAAIGLTVHGVRYHLRHLFAKLGVRNRSAAVHRARLLGLMSGERYR